MWNKININKPDYLTAQSFWDKACEYFQWCDDNPISIEIFKGDEIATISKRRIYNHNGLLAFMGLTKTEAEEYYLFADYRRVMEIINQVIYSDKFEGAAIGLYSANLIARDLGLSDKKEISTTTNEIVVLEIPSNGRMIN